MTARVAWLVVTMQLAAAGGRAQPAEPPAPALPPAPATSGPDPAADRALPPSGPVAGDPHARLELGIAAYRARDFARAVDELLEANRLSPELPDPYRWLALTDVQIGDCRSALINLDAFAARVPPDDVRLPELAALRDRCLSTGSLAVESTPSDAAIRIDGGPPIGSTPAKRLAMRAGPHTITVEKPGFEPKSLRVEVRALGTDYATFALTAVDRTPVYQRWWFWVGLGAALTAAGTTYALTRDPAPHFPGLTCNAGGCRP